MSFDLKKYLTENKLTNISKRSSLNEEETVQDIRKQIQRVMNNLDQWGKSTNYSKEKKAEIISSLKDKLKKKETTNESDSPYSEGPIAKADEIRSAQEKAYAEYKNNPKKGDEKIEKFLSTPVGQKYIQLMQTLKDAQKEISGDAPPTTAQWNKWKNANKNEINFRKKYIFNSGLFWSAVQDAAAAKIGGMNENDEFDSDQFEKEPSKSALKGQDKQYRGLDKKKIALKKLKDQVRAIQAQFGIVNGKFPSTGVGTKDQQLKQNYMKMVGKLPQQIKTLQAQIDKMENPHLDSEEI